MQEITSGGADFFALAAAKLDWLDRRNTVIAANIANANTPGYVPKDLPPFASMMTEPGAALLRTDPAHFPAGIGPDGAEDGAEDEAEVEQSPDRNGVSLSHEMASLAQTDDAQRAVTSLYHSYAGLLMTALGAASGG